MIETETRERIIRTLRNSNEPALSAADLADEIDVSVKTINNHLDRLTTDGRVQTHQIGNATAYYLDAVSEPRNSLPDHTCHRCGREVYERKDFSKVEIDKNINGTSPEPSVPNFYILCHFCHADVVAWLHNDDNSMGSYHYVERWDIPEEQKQEVIEDPEIDTEPLEGREMDSGLQ